jgi:chromate transporter
MMQRPTFWQVVRYFLILGATGFGGPVALVNYIRRDLVERDRWLTEEDYDRGLAIATACPGPLAYQLGVYCGYVTYGVGGGVGVGLAFAAAPFLIVVGIAALYVSVAGATWVRGVFYGVGPVVVALIVKACWNLGRKTLKRDAAAWVVAVLALVATIATQRELTWVFLAAGVVGILGFAPKASTVSPTPEPEQPTSVKMRATSLPLLFAFAPLAKNVGTWKLFAFFFKTGLLVFGSGLVVVSFIKAFVVDQYHWLDNRAFLDAVAVGMISPGPVVITATFVGYLVSGFWGALAATVGIFLPSILFTVIGTPLLLRYGKHRHVAGFVRGVTVAVVGVLTGTAYLVARPVIGDGITLTIAGATLAVPLLLKKIPDQVLVVVGAVLGVVLYPIIRPAWMP